MGLRFKKTPLQVAVEEMAHSNAIRGVPIFSTGKHNGREFVEQDIDDMIEAFKEQDWRPALKLGHAKPPKGQSEVGMPSYGWVTNLSKKIVNGVAYLMADFESMHDSVVNAIRTEQYDRVSAEIYMNLERGKKFFRRALKAVALLGAEVPAVANLTPLHKIEFADKAAGVFATEAAELDVSDADILATLEHRVAGIENFLSEESDMKRKDPKALARVKLQLAEFRTNIKKLKEDGAEEGEIAALQAKIDAAVEQVAEMENTDEDDPRVKALEATVTKLTAERNAERVEKRVERCKVKAFQPQLRALLAYAVAHPEEKQEFVTFDEKGKAKSEQKTLIEVVESFVDEINAKVLTLFKASTVSHDIDRSEDSRSDTDNVSEEVDEAVQALMQKDAKWEEKGYSATQKHILATDKELNDRYIAYMNQGDDRKRNSRSAH